MSSDFFRERPGAPDAPVFTRSSRARAARALAGALAVPLAAAALAAFAFHPLAGALTGLAVYLLLFRSLTAEAFARLWSFEILRVATADREVLWTLRRPGKVVDDRIPCGKILRVLEICDGPPGQAGTRSQLQLVAKDQSSVDLGQGPSTLAQPLAHRLAALLGVPHELERAQRLPSDGSGGADWNDPGAYPPNYTS